jgi:NAD(P)H-hydrate epimerase
MCRGIDEPDDLAPLLARADVIALGPGLGQGTWGRRMFAAALAAELPLVVDADGLNLLAEQPTTRNDWILTPHPGEAARLLRSDTRSVQGDRFAAVTQLQSRYQGVAILKGAGSLICDGSNRPLGLCSAGNPGMASGGSGDLLTGIVAALLAQGHGLSEAAELAVTLHATAGDRAALRGERGMLAGDMLSELRPLLNQVRDDVDH